MQSEIRSVGTSNMPSLRCLSAVIYLFTMKCQNMRRVNEWIAKPTPLCLLAEIYAKKFTEGS